MLPSTIAPRKKISTRTVWLQNSDVPFLVIIWVVDNTAVDFHHIDTPHQPSNSSIGRMRRKLKNRSTMPNCLDNSLGSVTLTRQVQIARDVEQRSEACSPVMEQECQWIGGHLCAYLCHQ